MSARIFFASTLALLTLVSAASLSATEQRQFDYMVNCQGCHLPDGSGSPDRQVPSFTGHLGKFLSVSGGREYLVQVPGSALSGLSDERLAGVLNWMLGAFSAEQLPADFKPYTGAEIRLWREHSPVNIDQVRNELLERIALQEEQQRTGTHPHEDKH
ncbi:MULTISPECIES: hypothetical protein [Pseudomonas]|uniref:c-type cytochrome n=1 Tax=Pseudomonas TaxID=286 RepID=UPI0003A623CF|nr:MULTISPECIES: hypothetical protein [Pseudomonas]NWE04811.1 hypothetical protein [Pseudomonas sp. IPO3749]NWF24554.1 hypothetical protein [Pseudomonas sp. IPO3749]